MAKTYLSSADFLKGITLEPEDFDVPGLGMVQLRGLTAMEMATISDLAGKNTGEMMALAVRYGLINPSMSDEDLPSLRSAAGLRFMPIAQRIMTLSGMGDAEQTEGEAGAGS